MSGTQTTDSTYRARQLQSRVNAKAEPRYSLPSLNCQLLKDQPCSTVEKYRKTRHVQVNPSHSCLVKTVLDQFYITASSGTGQLYKIPFRSGVSPFPASNDAACSGPPVRLSPHPHVSSFQHSPIPIAFSVSPHSLRRICGVRGVNSGICDTALRIDPPGSTGAC